MTREPANRDRSPVDGGASLASARRPTIGRVGMAPAGLAPVVGSAIDAGLTLA
jgi:hypothetical protein